MTDRYFEIHEHQEGCRLRLRLTGELDMASEPVLSNRLEQLRAQKRLVRLDLSGLDFMDCSGIHLLINAFDHTRESHLEIEVDPEESQQVVRLLKLANVEGFTGARLQQAFSRQTLRT